jgi:ADP-glucose pyrophosphorylase
LELFTSVIGLSKFFPLVFVSQVDTTILGLDPERAKELPYIASMGIYVFSKDVMLRLLREKFPSANDFGSEVIPGATEVGLRVCCVLETCLFFPLILMH